MLTKEEVETDLKASKFDIIALTQVVDGMIAFIENPCGEDRRFLRLDLIKWQGLLGQARRIHHCIEQALKELT